MAGVPEVLGERYELLEVLGRGGMGVVYRARDRVLDRVVAVKVLPLDRAQDPTAVARFEREALAAAGLSHRNIISVFDFGADQETRFIVMEYLAGESLARRVHERGALAVEEAVDVVAQVASALAAAHEAGIVHRDVKPANVMVNAQGHVKVLDFGIARLTAGISLTQTATVLGSAPYLAPELCRGAAADARSDIYALGCVLYELLTGRPPFTGELPAAIVHQQLSSAPRDPRELNPAIPPALGALCLAMLAKHPEQRPHDAGELVRALPATLADPAASAARRRMPIAAVPAAGIAADAAATAPLTDAAGALDATRVMPVRPRAATRVMPVRRRAATRVMPVRRRAAPRIRRNAALIGIIVIALVITLLAVTSGSGAPGRAGTKHHGSGTQTSPASSTSATSSTTTTGTTSTTGTVQTTPAVIPAGHQPGPHGGGPPPGKAKKHGPAKKHGGGGKQKDQ